MKEQARGRGPDQLEEAPPCQELWAGTLEAPDLLLAVPMIEVGLGGRNHAHTAQPASPLCWLLAAVHEALKSRALPV